MKRLLGIAILAALTTFSVFSQDSFSLENTFEVNTISPLSPERVPVPIRQLRPLGVNVVGGGAALAMHASINIDYCILPYVGVDLGFSPKDIYFGGHYYILGSEDRKNFSPYLGFLYNFTSKNIDGKSAFAYIPIGVNYVHDKGFSVSLEIAKLIPDQYFDVPYFFGVKAGYRIKLM